MLPCDTSILGPWAATQNQTSYMQLQAIFQRTNSPLILLKTQLTVAFCLAEDHFYTLTDAQQLCMHKSLYASLDDVNYRRAPHTVMGCTGPLQPGYTAAWFESM